MTVAPERQMYHPLTKSAHPRSCTVLKTNILMKVFQQILIIKPNRCTNFSNLFWNETLHVVDSSSVHHQEFFTVHTAMVYVQ